MEVCMYWNKLLPTLLFSLTAFLPMVAVSPSDNLIAGRHGGHGGGSYHHGSSYRHGGGWGNYSYPRSYYGGWGGNYYYSRPYYGGWGGNYYYSRPYYYNS